MSASRYPASRDQRTCSGVFSRQIGDYYQVEGIVAQHSKESVNRIDLIHEGIGSRILDDELSTAADAREKRQEQDQETLR